MDSLYHVRRHDHRMSIERHGSEAARTWMVGADAQDAEALADIRKVYRAAQHAYNKHNTSYVLERAIVYCDDLALGRTIFEHSFIDFVVAALENTTFVAYMT